MGRGSSGLRGGGGGGGAVRKFEDKAAYSHAYEGDGQETVEFFKENSNYDELISQMDYDERRAFTRWCSGVFMSGQQYKGFDKMSTDEQEMTRVYDKYLDQATLDHGVELARLSTAELVLGSGHRTGSMEDFSAMEGRFITSKGSMSAGAAAEGLTIGSSKQVEYHITIPGGTKGAGMWIGDSRINHWDAQQREFMINRDTSFRVGKTTYNSGRGVYVVNLEYVGLGNHDYGSSGSSSRRSSSSRRRSK